MSAAEILNEGPRLVGADPSLSYLVLVLAAGVFGRYEAGRDLADIGANTPTRHLLGSRGRGTALVGLSLVWWLAAVPTPALGGLHLVAAVGAVLGFACSLVLVLVVACCAFSLVLDLWLNTHREGLPLFYIGAEASYAAETDAWLRRTARRFGYNRVAAAWFGGRALVIVACTWWVLAR